MLHFNDVKKVVIQNIINHSKKDKDTRFFIIRDIFGRFSIYIVAPNQISKGIDYTIIRQTFESEGTIDWIDKIELLDQDDLFIEQLSIATQPIDSSDVIFFGERHVTKLNWFDIRERRSESSILKSHTKIVTYYSFKGGLGRTTSLVLTALQLVRQGKKVVIVDFDLEAPGLGSLLNSDNVKYGVFDYLIENQIYSKTGKKLDIDDYVYAVLDKDLIGSKGGQLYVMPVTELTSNNPEDYLEKISRIEFGMPNYSEENNPVHNMLSQISERFSADFIFIDARTGINDIGGLMLTRLSDIAVLLFYGNDQNMAGMRLVLPRIIKSQIPFFLVNGPVPTTEEERKEEEQLYLENAYKLFIESGFYNDDDTPDLYDKNADHYPLAIQYNPQASLINSTTKIKSLLECDGVENVYLKLAEEIGVYSDSNHTHEDIASMKSISRAGILDDIEKILTGDTAAAEAEFKTLSDLKNSFFPLKEHKFIFEQDKFLITGPKGSGKTALFSVLEQEEYARDLAKYAGVSAEYIKGTYWITGCKNSRDFPSPATFDSIGSNNNLLFYKNFWRCLAVRALVKKAESLGVTYSDEVRLLAECSYLKLPNLLNDNPNYSLIMEEFFSCLDSELEMRGVNIIITYDGLDVLLAKEYRGKMIAALISLWFEYLPRYSKLRVKIFLRDDIFKNEVKEGITDKVKLRNYTASLAWEYDYLLAMVWKRMAQRSNHVAELFNQALRPLGLSMIDYSNILGYIPKADPETNKTILKIIMGEKMGKGNKAWTYNWVRYHLADTNENIVPRSIIALFAFATRKEKEQIDSIYSSSLIRPKSFELVMKEVSEDRVTDLLEEYKDYGFIFSSIKNYQKYFPATEKEFKEALVKCGLSEGKEQTVIDSLQDIGVVRPYQRKLSDPVRYHIPDIYLLGMGLSRKGPGYFKTFIKS